MPAARRRKRGLSVARTRAAGCRAGGLRRGMHSRGGASDSRGVCSAAGWRVGVMTKARNGWRGLAVHSRFSREHGHEHLCIGACII